MLIDCQNIEVGEAKQRQERGYLFIEKQIKEKGLDGHFDE